MSERPKTKWLGHWGRYLPLAILATGLALFFILGLGRYVSFEALSRNSSWLQEQVRDHGFLAGLAYLLIYALATAFSVPGGAVLTITGGFLFGVWLGGLLTLFGATAGAVAVFLAARTAFGGVLRRKAGPAIRRMEAGFRDNALSYLLILRLIPIFPFWLVNIVPAFLGVPLSVYLIGTFFGIIPGVLVYASVGNGLGELLEAGRKPELDIIFQPSILLPLLGLALLALLPVLYKRYRDRARGSSGRNGPAAAPNSGDSDG